MTINTTLLSLPEQAYTTAMSFFVHATPAVTPKTPNTRRVAILVAAIYIVLALAQLFSFTRFSSVIYDMWLPAVDGQTAALLAALVVIGEVFAVPFLLSMRLSPAMRVVSMGLGWLVTIWWIVTLLWQNIMGSAPNSSGLFGATVALPVGWWSVCFMLGVAVLVAWVTWGQWPQSRRKL